MGKIWAELRRPASSPAEAEWKREMLDAETTVKLVQLVVKLGGEVVRGQRRRVEVSEAAGRLIAPALSEAIATLDRQLETSLSSADAELRAAVQKHREAIVASLPVDLVAAVQSFWAAEGVRLQRQAAERKEREIQRRTELALEQVKASLAAWRPPEA